MRSLCLALAAVLSLAACQSSPTAPMPAAVVRTGTSFGECIGYCFKEVEVQGLQAGYVLRQWIPDPSEIRGMTLIAAHDWLALQRVIDLGVLSTLPDVIGCPDCADGGAEWIEVEVGDTRKRVTFEFGLDIPAIQPLVETARRLRVEVLPEVRRE